jgi:hypothetical protein
MTKIAKPIEDSAAATVKTSSVNICPIISSRYTENNIKLKLIDNNNNSILIKSTIKLRFNNTIPKMLIKNNIVDIKINLKISKFIIIFFFLLLFITFYIR